MGNCNLKADEFDPTVALSRSAYQFHHPIGKGGFGKVWQATHKKTKTICAVKEMLKARIIAKRSAHSVMNERTLLAVLAHPFIINMFSAFQDREYLYLALELKGGGDLRFHLTRCRRFTEEQTRFFVACLVLALEYLHSNGVLHRDIKPENLVLDCKGYVYLTDFGVARVWQPNNANETSGTPGYMAPEVLCRQQHSFPVDYFALGVLMFEFMTGKRPYLGRNRKEIRDAMFARQARLESEQLPYGWSALSLDFCNRLIQRKPGDRLGARGIAELKYHPWLSDFAWGELLAQEVPAPFVPSATGNFDERQVQNEWKDDETVAAVKKAEYAGAFEGYSFEAKNGPFHTTAMESLK